MGGDGAERPVVPRGGERGTGDRWRGAPLPLTPALPHVPLMVPVATGAEDDASADDVRTRRCRGSGVESVLDPLELLPSAERCDLRALLGAAAGSVPPAALEELVGKLVAASALESRETLLRPGVSARSGTAAGVVRSTERDGSGRSAVMPVEASQRVAATSRRASARCESVLAADGAKDDVATSDGVSGSQAANSE